MLLSGEALAPVGAATKPRRCGMSLILNVCISYILLSHQ